MSDIRYHPDAMARRFFILGPTASGKGRLAVETALRAGGEVISVDSMKVYRGMDVGTAKPSPAARRGVPFHLLSIRDPHERMSVTDFMREAAAAEAGIRARGKRAIFEGGTALYVRGLTEGVFEGPAADPELRGRLEAEARATPDGRERLHARLAEVDAKTAARLHPNDVRRVVRALEVHAKTRKPISLLQREWTDFDGEAREGTLEKVRAERWLVGLEWPREALHRRIDARVVRMFDEGFVDECLRLLADPKGVSREAEQALGYRELFAWARAGQRTADLPLVREEIQRHTRQFAKRQMTFWRHFPDVEWVPMSEDVDTEVLAERLAARLADDVGGGATRPCGG